MVPPELAVEPSPVMVKGPAPVLLRKIPRVGPLAAVPVVTLLKLKPFPPMVVFDTNTPPPVLEIIILGELVLSEVSYVTVWVPLRLTALPEAVVTLTSLIRDIP